MDSIVKYIYKHSLEQPQKVAVIATDYEVDYATLWTD